MAVLSYPTHVEIYKFKQTGMLPLFDEVIEFVRSEHVNYGHRWEAVDLYSTDNEFIVRLEQI